MVNVVRSITFLVLLLFTATATADSNNFSKRKDVQQFIQEMVKKHGFTKKNLVALFNQVKVRPQVIHNLNKPLEKEPWHLYQVLFVNQKMIRNGVTFWNKYQKSLAEAEKVYGVPASIIVASIGMESKYGHVTGDYRVIDALVNIGFSDSRRALVFRHELEEFLLLTREQHLDPLKVMGSYAGAIGQPQFMPSSYRYYAVNFSKSGHIDLMHDQLDVIGSIANYYKRHGWKTNDFVAQKVKFSGKGYQPFLTTYQSDGFYTLGSLKKLGIQPTAIVKDPMVRAILIELSNRHNKEYWLGFHNFVVIRRYNSSNLYAMAIYQLSTNITALRERVNHGYTPKKTV